MARGKRNGDHKRDYQMSMIANYGAFKQHCSPQARTPHRNFRSDRPLKTSYPVISAPSEGERAVDNSVDKKVIERGFILLSVRTRSGINRS